MRVKPGTIDLVLLGVLWGSIGVIVKDVRVSSPAIAMFRMGIGSLAVLLYHALRGRLNVLRLRDRKGLLILDGLLLAVHWVLMFEAFKRLSVAAAILLVFLGPVFVAAAVGPVLGERVERRTVASLALSLGGMALIAAPAWRVQDPAGVAFALGSAVAFAAVMMAGKVLTRTYSPPAILVWQTGVGAIAVAPIALSGDLGGLGDSLPGLITLGLVHTGLAGLFYFRALTVVKAQHVGVLTYLEPATAVLYAWALLDETPSAATLAGGALIMIAGLNIVASRGPAPVSPSEPVAPPPQARHD